MTPIQTPSPVMPAPVMPARRRARSTSARGFTLIEILCVVIIMGISAAIIVPELSTRDDLKASACAREIMADLLYAQNQSITTEKKQFVVFDTTNQVYGIYPAASGGGPGSTAVTNPTTMMPYTVTLGATSQTGCTLKSVDFGGGLKVIGFDELGTPYVWDSGASALSAMTGTGQVQVQCGTHVLTISVEQDTGEITVQ